MNQATLRTDDSMIGVMLMVMELSLRQWKLGFSDGQKNRYVTVEARDLGGLRQAIAKAKQALGLAADAPVYSCYEAGRDGFWIHRFLQSEGISNMVVDSASLEVNRKARRAKTDRLDVRKLLEQLRRYYRGEDSSMRAVRVPSEASEDGRRLHREEERLKNERGQHRARLKSLLVLHGLVDVPLALHDWPAVVKAQRQWNGRPLPWDLQEELIREGERLVLVEEQLARLRREKLERLEQGTHPYSEQVKQLMLLKALGPGSAWLFVMEFYGWRRFRNRRQVGSLAGLTGTPYASGDSYREQGISKAGNRRVRYMIMEIAWGWLRYQPHSALSQWFHRKYGSGGKRQRRVGIVALARKLLIALWRYLEHGEIPAGAQMKG